MTSETADQELLSVRGLKTYFRLGTGWRPGGERIRAVDGVDFTVGRGEIVGVVGESGSGKTTLGRSILRLVEPTAGSVLFDGVDLLALSRAEMRGMRRRMQIVFQDPYGALSPRMQIGRILGEALRLHGIVPEDAVHDRTMQLLERVGLEDYFAYRYPHEMSGGQRQRVMIARALSLGPEFIVADEPVSALDVSVQAQILAILRDLREHDGIAMVFITHDVSVVERIADRVVVMYRGRVMEEASTESLIQAPAHPYTQALLSAVPKGRPGEPRTRVRLVGEAPSATEPLPGCPFATRCPHSMPECSATVPEVRLHSSGHHISCHLA